MFVACKHVEFGDAVLARLDLAFERRRRFGESTFEIGPRHSLSRLAVDYDVAKTVCRIEKVVRRVSVHDLFSRHGIFLEVNVLGELDRLKVVRIAVDVRVRADNELVIAVFELVTRLFVAVSVVIVV